MLRPGQVAHLGERTCEVGVEVKEMVKELVKVMVKVMVMMEEMVRVAKGQESYLATSVN